MCQKDVRFFSIVVARNESECSDVMPVLPSFLRRLPESLGDGCTFQEGSSEDTGVFCAEDDRLDAELRHLHGRLKKGDGDAQVLIDGRLMACWLASNRPELYRRLPRAALVMHPALSYHHGNLPDIGRFVVHSLIHKDWKSNIIVNVICNSMPCLKRNRVIFMPEPSFADPQATILVNILHGLLMGLYPNTAKRPSFWCRVRVAGELRRVMTSGLKVQARFLYANLNLLKLAMMEYVWFMCSRYLVTEREAVSHVCGMGMFMEVCPNMADIFRQDYLQGTGWAWSELDASAALIVDKCVRTCKFRMGRSSAMKAGNAKWRRVADDQNRLFRVALEMHVPSYSGILWSLYSHRYPDLSLDDFNLVEHIQGRCCVYPLPSNLAAAQCQVLLSLYGSDFCQLDNVMKVHVCMRCCNKGLNEALGSKLRLCMRTGELFCANCASGGAVISINMLGKVLVVHGVSYFLCPVCGRCRRWNFTGTEFTCLDCCHAGCRPAQKPPAKRCVRCSKTTNLERMAVISSTFGVNLHVYVCSKHSLPPHLMKYARDVSDYCRSSVRYEKDVCGSRRKPCRKLR